MFDSGLADNLRIIVFGTTRTCSLLSESAHWFMDGTFAVVPELFFQLYTVHFLVAGLVQPAFYCLLLNKTQDTYIRLFREIQTLVDSAQPTTAMMDYEKAAMNAFCTVFPKLYFMAVSIIWLKLFTAYRKNTVPTRNFLWP